MTITVIDCDRVIDPSNGPSSPHANGKSGFSVAIPQADAADNDVDGIVALPLVVEENVGVVNDELILLPVVDGTDVDGPSEDWSVGSSPPSSPSPPPGPGGSMGGTTGGSIGGTTSGFPSPPPPPESLPSPTAIDPDVELEP